MNFFARSFLVCLAACVGFFGAFAAVFYALLQNETRATNTTGGFLAVPLVLFFVPFFCGAVAAFALSALTNRLLNRKKS